MEADVSGLYVKVSMDGAPYLRKIDLNVYKSYPELLKALENMFKCTIGKNHTLHTIIRWWSSGMDQRGDDGETVTPKILKNQLYIFVFSKLKSCICRGLMVEMAILLIIWF